MKKIWTNFTQFLQEWWEKIRISLDAVLLTPERKAGVLLFTIFLEVLLAYIIAIMDMGIWISDISLAGMIRGYWTHGSFYPLWIFLILGSLILIAVYYFIVTVGAGNTGRRFSLSGSNVYGNGRNITTEELKLVAEIGPKEEVMGTILGQLDKTEQRLIASKHIRNFNDNIVAFGAPGTGKSFCFVENFILQAIRRGESVICTDTKGELWADTVEVARRHGYIVRRLDLKNPEFSDGWDVLSELRHDDMRSLIFAKTVMANTGTQKDIHAAAEESLLNACCLYKERIPDQPEGTRTFYNAFSLLLQGATNLDAAFKQAGSAYPEEMRTACDAYATFLQGSENLRGNVISGLANRLRVLSSPPVRRLTSTPDIDLSLPGRERCIYYCVTSDQHETMKFIASLFFSFAFLDLVDLADSQPDRKLAVPVNVLFEEFANVGEIPNIAKYLSTCRSRRIAIQLVVQSLGQLKGIYEEEMTNTILADCATMMCLGVNDRDTAELLEWRAGEATVQVKTEQHEAVEPPIRFGLRNSTGDGRRNFYTANELMKMKTGQIFLIWQRYDCLMAHTFGINRHVEYLSGRMKTISTNTIIPLSDKEARKFLREQEEARVQDYKNWIAMGGNPWKGYRKPKPAFTGPASGTDLPDIIPYPDLEEMALAHSAKVEQERKQEKEKKRQEKVSAVKAEKPQAASEPRTADQLEIIILPTDIKWERAFSEPDPEPAREPEAQKSSNSSPSPRREQAKAESSAGDAKKPSKNAQNPPVSTKPQHPAAEDQKPQSTPKKPTVDPSVMFTPSSIGGGNPRKTVRHIKGSGSLSDL